MKRHKHAIAATLLVLIASAIVAFAFQNTTFFPRPASTQAEPIDQTLRLLFIIGGVISALCLVLLIYNTIAFRQRRKDAEDGPPVEGHSGLELAWTLIPLAIVLLLAVQGAGVLGQITQAPQEAEEELEIKVTAFQWAWLFEYPQYGITTGELRLPVDRPVLLKLTSRDVIHSFWVPEFRVKQDAVPGQEKVLRFTPTIEGSYKLWCAELCGLGHTIMQASVIVMEPAQFELWLKEQRR